MWSLSNMGRIFYGIAIAVTGLLTIYYRSFPYWLLPSQPLVTGLVLLTYICGGLFILVGVSIIFKIKIGLTAFLFGFVFLLIFCFLYIPYMFSASSNYMHLTEWENAEKELSMAGGAFIIAGCFSNPNAAQKFWRRLIPFGIILFSVPIISFGILHFQLAKQVATLVPSWIPKPVFWAYFAGAALLGSGIAIILKIRPGLIATLLGTMIFIWFIILHIPRVVVSSSADFGGEVISAFLALAYSGTAFLIAGDAKNGNRISK